MSVMMRSALVVVSWLWAACAAGEAKTLYVNAATGNDATTYAANSASAPWKTIGRAAWGSGSRSAPNAAEAAKAGDVVRVAAGTYTTVATDYRFGPAYSPANSGSEGKPIRFEAEGVVHLTFSSGTGPMIGAEKRHYIEWSGFTINETTAPSRSDTGQVVFVESTGGSVENCVLIGNPNWTSRVGDNYDAIRIHGSKGQRIFNNRISGYGGQTGDENHNGIETYFAADLLIEHNEIENSGSGIYLKGNNPRDPVVGRFTIRYNLFHRNNDGIRVLLIPGTAAQPTLIYQNIFRGNQMGVTVQVFDRGRADARHAKIVNNTFVDNHWGLFVGGAGGMVDDAGHVFWNNIVGGGEWAIMYTHRPENLDKTRFDFEHNVYYGNRGHSEVGGDGYSLGDWKRQFRQDAAKPPAAQRDPQWVDPGRGDYRLRPGSPARKAGVDILDLDRDGSTSDEIDAGAYVSGDEVIGRVSSPGATARP